MASLHQILKVMVEKGSSDLHITTGSPPQLRIDGALVPIRMPPLSPAETQQLCYSILTETQKQSFEETNELDLSFGVKGLARFRANVFIQRGAVAGVFRQIPLRILSMAELGLPPVVEALAKKPRGLILVCGPTGSGKSTTLAAIIDKINSDTHGHIITIEDPIEYIHPHKKCLVNQREIGTDTDTFKGALRYVLRQDPDVVLVGELRDQETIEAGLTVAETGHLTLATLHTNSAVQSMNRIIDVFPANQQGQIRAQLSFVLEGVLCQQLVPRISGQGREMAMEILVPNSAIRNLIREDKMHQLYSQMQVGQAKFGMQTMNQALMDLYVRRLISLDDALARCKDPEEFRTMLQNAGASTDAPGRPGGMRR
jgi:twitching motility protein PilT